MPEDDEPFRLSRHWLWACGLGALGGLFLAYADNPAALDALKPWVGVAGLFAAGGAGLNLMIILVVLPWRLLRLSDRSVA